MEGTEFLLDRAERLADELVDYLAVRVDHRHHQWHLAEGVCGATEAGIEGADHGLDAVERARGELAVLHVSPRRLQHAAVHRVVVMAGGDDQVGPGNLAVLVHLVVVV